MHTIADYHRLIRRFPEDNDATYKARIDMAISQGFEAVEDEDLTRAGIQAKATVMREVGGDTWEEYQKLHPEFAEPPEEETVESLARKLVNELLEKPEPSKSQERRRYRCRRCGYETVQKTNHQGPTWSWGHFNTCPNCPPWAKYPEFGGSTEWDYVGEVAEAHLSEKLETERQMDGFLNLCATHGLDLGSSEAERVSDEVLDVLLNNTGTVKQKAVILAQRFHLPEAEVKAALQAS